jgi:hypothetical protein
VKQTIEHNAAEIRRLHLAVRETCAHRSESQEAFEAWERACAEYHSCYDALAFPGGLTAAFERLAAGDPLTAETAVVFVESHPYYSCSQYHTTKLIKLLKRLRLRPDLQKRFDAVLTARREHRTRKEAERMTE